jgi:GAF domain-containing protein
LKDNGCGSVLGVPLSLDNNHAAALNFFNSGPGVFTDPVVRRAEGFAELAGQAVRLALKIADAQNVAENLSAALEHRTVINLPVV